MTREAMTPEAYSALLESITAILMKNGLKATTMDSIATALQMSKRTLYEIFESKSVMVREVMSSLHRRLCEKHKEIFQSSSNVLEAILLSFLHHRDLMSEANVAFFRDMDSHFSDARIHSDDSRKHYHEDLVSLMRQGVKEGYFRKDINYMVQCRMMSIQMESLKRMEELFPPDITLLEVYDSICISFLRGISSPKGLEILDGLLEKHNFKTEV